jgi:ribosomal protein S18 acetylase RimI-like enzyme
VTDHVQALLETDRDWAVYALCDLAPPHAQFSEWRVADDRSALLLLYREFATPVLFAFGPSEAVARLLAGVHEPELYLLIRPEHLPVVTERYRVAEPLAMWRMTLRVEAFSVTNGHEWRECARLGPEHFAQLEALYADGADTGEAPDFFNRAQVECGVFYGVREGDALMAAAGTHLFSEALGIGAVGNVYVRRDRRSRGLGRTVTRAVTAELLRRNLRTVGLNVRQDNAAAIRVYESLGYRRYCPFYEGLAVLK